MEFLKNNVLAFLIIHSLIVGSFAVSRTVWLVIHGEIFSIMRNVMDCAASIFD